MPASQTIVFPRYCKTQQDLPTSCPAPRQVMLNVGASDMKTHPSHTNHVTEIVFNSIRVILQVHVQQPEIKKEVSRWKSNVGNSLVHIPYGSRCSDRKFAELLFLSQILDLGIDQVSEPFQVQTSFSTRSHEDVAPQSASRHGIIDSELQRTMKTDHLLHKVVRTRVNRIWPRYADSEPPTEWLYRCHQIDNPVMLTITYPSVRERPFRVRIICR
jgi:hypothetical protein